MLVSDTGFPGYKHGLQAEDELLVGEVEHLAADECLDALIRHGRSGRRTLCHDMLVSDTGFPGYKQSAAGAMLSPFRATAWRKHLRR